MQNIITTEARNLVKGDRFVDGLDILNVTDAKDSRYVRVWMKNPYKRRQGFVDFRYNELVTVYRTK